MRLRRPLENEPTSRPAAPLRRAWVAALVLLGMLGVVALVAAARDGARGGGDGVEAPPPLFFDYVLSTALALYLVLLPFALWLAWRYRGARARDPNAGKQRDLIALAAVAVACLTVVAIARLRGEIRIPEAATVPAVTGTATGAAGEAGAPERRADFRWTPLLVLGGAAAAWLAYRELGRRRRRASLEARGDDALVDAFATLVDDTLDDLLAEPDPRRAVIAAYARMERALGAWGAPRRAAEAPLEYLERLAPSLRGIPGAPRLVFELTHLYERAKFSPDVVDVEMKTAAIAALQSLRAELMEPAA